MMQCFLHRITAITLSLALLAASPLASVHATPPGFEPVQKLLDLSGLAWINDDLFLAVHDAKYPDEEDRIRVSLLLLPESLDGLLWKPLQPLFPDAPSSDLESASRIPRSHYVLLVESGDDGGEFDRIFLADVRRNKVFVRDFVQWRSFYDVFNVEATAVARNENGDYIFIWGERAEGSASTVIRWTDLQLEPFSIGSSGKISEAIFVLADDTSEYNRPLVGLDVDAEGHLFGVAAFDPDSDDGPYRSAVYELGMIVGDELQINEKPAPLAILDGFKTESVSLQQNIEATGLFIGTDDENYGGTLRPLPY